MLFLSLVHFGSISARSRRKRELQTFLREPREQPYSLHTRANPEGKLGIGKAMDLTPRLTERTTEQPRNHMDHRPMDHATMTTIT